MQLQSQEDAVTSCFWPSSGNPSSFILAPDIWWLQFANTVLGRSTRQLEELKFDLICKCPWCWHLGCVTPGHLSAYLISLGLLLMLVVWQQKFARFSSTSASKGWHLSHAVASSVTKGKHRVRKCICRLCSAARLLLSCSLFSLQGIGSNLSFPLQFPGLVGAPVVSVFISFLFLCQRWKKSASFLCFTLQSPFFLRYSS